jgi:purine-binding chemotaxis protein CheW
MSDTAAAALEEKKEKGAKIDFKMVTFSLAGKEYGIDIMNVKEIAKANKFTYVPNAVPFVRGVYNLRGDIISIIDLRIMFHLPAETKAEDALENLLILRMRDHVFGIIVDSIDKVVGISREQMQPPHPIFSDINIKYISGVVESESKLYIVLDAERIFAPKAEKKEAEAAGRAAHDDAEPVAEDARLMAAGPSELDLTFIKETLATFKGFHVSPVNEAWVNERFLSWKKERKGGQLQLKDQEDAAAFLAPFYSSHSGAFWSGDYLEAFEAILPDAPSKIVNVWNPGCGMGHETYSLACALKIRYPEAKIKVWANDSDLLSISMAPNLVFKPGEVPDYYSRFLVEGKNGLSFDQSIRECILFEYHDVLNTTPLPDIDLIVCRDLLSFLKPHEQARVIEDFAERIKVHGICVVGQNEALPEGDGWKRVKGLVSAYARSR